MEIKPHYAGFWIRFVAHVIDSFLLHFGSVVLQLIYLGGLFWFQVLVRHKDSLQLSYYDLLDPLTIQIMIIGLRFVLSLSYYTYFTWRFGTTLGKRFFRITVVSENNFSPITLKQSLIRYFGYFLSAVPFALGYVMAGIHPKKQALHDWLAKTVCIFRGKDELTQSQI